MKVEPVVERFDKIVRNIQSNLVIVGSQPANVISFCKI